MSRILIGLAAIMSVNGCAEELYASERAIILAREADMSVGGNITLTREEERANEILMKHKLEEVDKGFLHPEEFNCSRHYFKYKNNIDRSKLYHILKKMPKGGALHLHDMGILGPDYLVSLTYLDDLYVCFLEDTILLKFADRTPEAQGQYIWQSMKEARAASGNETKFDREIRKHFTIVIDNPETVDTNVNVVWKRFISVFDVVFPMVTYKPIWEKYFYDALEALRQDKIMYAEVRSLMPPLYDLNGTTYDSLETGRAYKRAYDRYMRDHPDFFGAKVIFAPARSCDDDEMEDYLKTARQMKKELGHFFAGFDLVGQEDKGRPLKDFVPLLTSAKGELDYFFHSGETNWWGTTSDENLVDAVLLGSKRLGHAYAIVKHPLVAEIVRKNEIGVEVNVISNQVLGLVADLRNHPLSQFLAQNMPVVLSGDDPGLWEAPPISHDFYVAIVGVANKHAGLRTLKQLVLNSIRFSALAAQDKQRASSELELRWDNFIRELILE